LWLAQGDLAAAEKWATGIEPTTHDDLDPALEFEHMTVARIWIAQGRLDEARQLLARLFSAAETAGRMGRVIEICLIQAVLASMQADNAQAIEKLTYALALAEPEGFVRTFVDEGAPMETLLREARRRGIAQEYVGKLLAAFDSAPSASSRPRIGDEVEPLSVRELEVLRLIADGASNREIAQSLIVTIGTVKRHLNNIFTKLDAHSRTQAVATARKKHLF
jgi:LuxR family maltose regulon positive regulatory protein